MQIAVIGLGANLGERRHTLESAIRALAHSPHLRVVRVSPVYETEAVGPPQPNYLNAAVRIETELDPEVLLDVLLTIEIAHGRIRKERWGPRTLDLDILAMCEPETYVSRKITTPRLIVPHPSLFERSFALAPLLDVMPELESQWGVILRTLGGAPNQIPNHWDFGTSVG